MMRNVTTTKQRKTISSLVLQSTTTTMETTNLSKQQNQQQQQQYENYNDDEEEEDVKEKYNNNNNKTKRENYSIIETIIVELLLSKRQRKKRISIPTTKRIILLLFVFMIVLYYNNNSISTISRLFHFTTTTTTTTTTIQHDDNEIEYNTNKNTIINNNKFNVYPPLTKILNKTNFNIIGNPQFLLDFAIIGFPKCGTTALQYWLTSTSTSSNTTKNTNNNTNNNNNNNNNIQIVMLEKEVFNLYYNHPERLIYNLYTKLNVQQQRKIQLQQQQQQQQLLLLGNQYNNNNNNLIIIKRGYKNPLDIRSSISLQHLSNYFPNTILIIGLRHPIHWFQSYYNFKIQNIPTKTNTNTNTLGNNFNFNLKEYLDEYYSTPNQYTIFSSSSSSRTNTTINTNCLGTKDWNNTNCISIAKGFYLIHLLALGKINPIPKQYYDLYITNPLYSNFFLKPNTKHNTITTTTNNNNDNDSEYYYNNNNYNNNNNYPSISNKIFLYEIQQLHDSNKTRQIQFRNDIEQYVLKLSPKTSNNNDKNKNQRYNNNNNNHYNKLSIMIPKIKPDYIINNKKQQKLKNKYKITNICNPKYKPIRNELLMIGKLTYDFLITKYKTTTTTTTTKTSTTTTNNNNTNTNTNNYIYTNFLSHPDIIISSPDYFLSLIKQWTIDPCENKTKNH